MPGVDILQMMSDRLQVWWWAAVQTSPLQSHLMSGEEHRHRHRQTQTQTHNHTHTQGRVDKQEKGRHSRTLTMTFLCLTIPYYTYTLLFPGLGPFCVEFACSPCACVGSLWVLWIPPTVQRPAYLVNWRL